MMQLVAHAPETGRKSRVWWALEPGAALTRWVISAPISVPYAGIARPHPDQVDYRFVNGWVATGDLPCREALRKEISQFDPELPEDNVFREFYFGEENPRVDFSTFCFQPTRISRWARSFLRADVAQTVRLAVTTCGIVHLWIDGRKVLMHQPLDRNVPHEAQLEVALEGGEHEVTVYLEDLHERDTSCFFEVRLLQGQGLSSGLDAEVDERRIKDVEKVLAGLRTTRLFYEEGMLALVCDHTPEEPVTIRLSDGATAGSSSTMDARANGIFQDEDLSFSVSKAGEEIPLIEASRIPCGCFDLVFRVDVGDVRLEKTLGTTVLANKVVISGASLTERKAEARKLIADEPEATITRALLLLSEKGDAREIEEIIRHTLKAINGRYDCSDFWMLPLIWAWNRYHDTQLSPELWADVRSALLNFRYWLDEPGNDVMWFWSENHVFCFHVAQLLAGEAFAGEVFTNSGKTGAEHRAQARGRLDRWFDSIEEHGLAEWNSAAYYPIDLLGLFTLYENTSDEALKARAKGLLDRLFTMVALHTVAGTPVGSQGRIYEKELFAGPGTELATIAAVAFGGLWCIGLERAAALFSLSSYTPPEGLEQLHRPRGNTKLEARYTQGVDQNAKLSLWKTADIQLSSVSDHRTGELGHQQHVADLQFASHPLARSFVSHPGELKVWGSGRPSYWAGNGIVPRVTQTQNICALVYDLTLHETDISFTHLFVPSEILDEHEVEAHWAFMRGGNGYAAIWCSAPLTPLTRGLYAGSEWRAQGEKMAWLMIAGSEATHGSFAGFREQVRAVRPEFDPDAVAVDYEASGKACRTSFVEGLFQDGKAIPFAPLSVMPHVAVDGGPLISWLGKRD